MEIEKLGRRAFVTHADVSVAGEVVAHRCNKRARTDRDPGPLSSSSGDEGQSYGRPPRRAGATSRPTAASCRAPRARGCGNATRTRSRPYAGSVGTVKGTDGRLNCISTRVTWPGFMRTVSFQPSSFGSGAMAAPCKFGAPPAYCLTLKACLESTCTFTKWKWMGCVSPVRLTISQTSVAPLVTELSWPVRVRATEYRSLSAQIHGLIGAKQLDQPAEGVERLVQRENAHRHPDRVWVSAPRVSARRGMDRSG